MVTKKLVKLPDLTFPMLEYGPKETPLDLSPFLYKGGAGTYAPHVGIRIKQGTLGSPILERLPLVEKVHEHLLDKLISGGSSPALTTNARSFRKFVSYVDSTGLSLNLSTVQQHFMNWTDSWLQRVRVKKDVLQNSAYGICSHVGTILDAVLERSRPLISQTRLRRKFNLSQPSAKQDLDATFQFGHLLHDICAALTLDVVRGPLPIKISLRTGHCLEKWCGLGIHKDKATTEVIEAHDRNTSNKARSRILNLKTEAEILMFIAQTGMNWAQALDTKLDNFRYTSHTGGYRVRNRKNRRHGDVEFEIFKEYRPHFDAYIAWRRAIFPEVNDDSLFKFVRSGGARAKRKALGQISALCETLQLKFISPQRLRKTRINFLLRESNDLNMTADMAQHSKKTLLRQYLQPNHQVAIVEIHRFHQRHDPTLSPPGPGLCVAANPELIKTAPRQAPQPNCVNPGGCLFCTMQRDIDSQDYLWSLASYRHLKTLELSMSKQVSMDDAALRQSAELIVQHITLKLKHFDASSSIRRSWVQESKERISEGDYHPMWNVYIGLWESGV